MSLFTTEIKRIGSEVDAFKEQNMMVTFYENVPEDLATYCHIISPVAFEEEIAVGDTLIIDEVPYKITFVGEVVKTNLISLGHITINFNGESDGLAGTLGVENKLMPTLSVGSKISLTK